MLLLDTTNGDGASLIAPRRLRHKIFEARALTFSSKSGGPTVEIEFVIMTARAFERGGGYLTKNDEYYVMTLGPLVMGIKAKEV